MNKRSIFENLSEMRIYFDKILKLYSKLPEGTLPQDQEIDTLCEMSKELIEGKLKEMQLFYTE